MKSNAKSPLYFSAYPLKAIRETTPASSSLGQTPYLRSVLSGKTKASRVRVFPMADPYPSKKQLAKPVKLTREVEGSGEAWFHHYE